MRGIHAALEGRLGQDMELRTSAAGKDWARLSVGVGEGDELTWVSVAVFEEKARALAGLAKGVEVYVEGRLSLNTWPGRDGAERTGCRSLHGASRSWGGLERAGRRRRRLDASMRRSFNDALTF